MFKAWTVISICAAAAIVIAAAYYSAEEYVEKEEL